LHLGTKQKDSGCLICMFFWKFYCSRNPPCGESVCMQSTIFLPNVFTMQLSKATWKSSDCIGMCYMKNTTMRSDQQLQTRWIGKPNITFQSVINFYKQLCSATRIVHDFHLTTSPYLGNAPLLWPALHNISIGSIWSFFCNPMNLNFEQIGIAGICSWYSH